MGGYRWLKRRDGNRTQTVGSKAGVAGGALERLTESDEVSVEQAAQMLGLTTRRIRQLIEEGKLEAIRTQLGAFRITRGAVIRERERRSSGPLSSAQAPTPMGASLIDDGHLLPEEPGGGKTRGRMGIRGGLIGAISIGLLGVFVGVAELSGHEHGEPILPASISTARVAPPQQVVLVIDPPPQHGVINPNGSLVDAYVPSDFTVQQGKPVHLTIFNFDDKPHTFTSPQLAIDALAPPATRGAAGRVSVTFTATAAGSFTWHCKVHCNMWSMKRFGYMRGTIKVVAA